MLFQVAKSFENVFHSMLQFVSESTREVAVCFRVALFVLARRATALAAVAVMLDQQSAIANVVDSALRTLIIGCVA